MVGARSAVDSHHGRAFYHRRSVGHDGRPGHIEPETHVTQAHPHPASSRARLAAIIALLRDLGDRVDDDVTLLARGVRARS